VRDEDLQRDERKVVPFDQDDIQSVRKGELQGGRLYDTLVRGSEIADAVSAGADVLGERLARIYWVQVQLKKGVDPARGLDALDHVLDELRAKGPTREELAQARARHAGALLWSLERTTHRADLLNAGSWFARDPAALVKTQQSAEASTPESLRDAVARWLPKDRRAIVLVRPVAGAPVSGRLVQGGRP
jgi:predicted Zn-dependent peptidase